MFRFYDIFKRSKLPVDPPSTEFVDVELNPYDENQSDSTQSQEDNDTDTYVPCSIYITWVFAVALILGLGTFLASYAIIHQRHNWDSFQSTVTQETSTININVDATQISTTSEAESISRRFVGRATPTGTRFDHVHGHKADQIVPLDVYVENGATHTRRVGHSHIKPAHAARDRPPSTHFETKTRTLPYTTDDQGEVWYQPTAALLPHTHVENGWGGPVVPNINPTMTYDEARDYAYPDNLHTHTTESLHSDVYPQSTIISQDRLNKMGAISGDNTSDRTTYVSTAHDHTQPSGSQVHTSVSHTNSLFESGSLTSTIYDEFWNYTYTVTPAGSGTWRQLLPEITPTPTSRLTGSLLGGPFTRFDPVSNVTWEYAVYDSEDGEEILWEPIATGEPTRTQDIAKVSSWRAAGGSPPALPTPQLIFDSHTNTTWKQTAEGEVIQWTAVFVSVTTGPTPAFTHPTVPYVPEWPPMEKRDKTNNAPAKSEPDYLLSILTNIYPEAYVLNEWLGNCNVVKHITGNSSIDHERVVPWSVVFKNLENGREIGQLRSDCNDDIDYFIYIKNDTEVGQLINKAIFSANNERSQAIELAMNAGQTITIPLGTPESSQVPSVPTPVRIPGIRFLQGRAEGVPTEPTDFLYPEWTDDCFVILHRGETHSAVFNASRTYNSEFPRNGKPLHTYPSQAAMQENCEDMKLLMHVEEYHGAEAFSIGDFQIRPENYML